MEMKNDALQERIRQSVARAVREELQAPRRIPENGRNKILILAPEAPVGFQQLLNSLQEKHRGCLLCVCAPPGLPAGDGRFALNLREEADRAQVMEHLREFQRIYVFEPGLALLEQVARCSEETFPARLIFAALLRKREVVWTFDYDPTEAGGVLSGKMERLLRSAREMKIRLLFPGSEERKADGGKTMGNGLITQQDVDEMWKAGAREFQKSARCIVTPLAKDRIRELGMRVLST